MKEFLTALAVAGALIAVPSVAALEQIDQEYAGNSGPDPSDTNGVNA
jgi:hypothetical protein